MKTIFAVVLLLAATACFGQGSPTTGILPDSGVTIPASCSAPQLFFQTGSGGAGAGLYFCNGGTFSKLGTSGGLPAGLSFAAPTLTVSVAGSGNGSLALSGNTSGACTYTTDATGTLVTQNCRTTFPSGAASTLGWNFAGNLGSGMFWDNAVGTVFNNNGSSIAAFDSVGWRQAGGDILRWTSAAYNSGVDLGLSRDTISTLDVGGGTASSTTGKVKAAGYLSLGTKFTTNAGCGESAGTISGGATTAKITTAGSTSCTTIVTFGDTATAANGWACQVVDLTTAADYYNPRTTSTATTLTIVTGTIVSGDVLQVGPCEGY